MAEEEVQQQMEGDEESVPVMVDRSKLTPNMRHYLQMSKLHSQNEYAKGPVGLYRSDDALKKTTRLYSEYSKDRRTHNLIWLRSLWIHANFSFDVAISALHIVAIKQLISSKTNSSWIERTPRILELFSQKLFFFIFFNYRIATGKAP